jgi:hypothetical protein
LNFHAHYPTSHSEHLFIASAKSDKQSRHRLARHALTAIVRDSEFRILRVRACFKFCRSLLAPGLTCAVLIGSVQMALSDGCKPSHYRALYFIKSMGACSFDPETLSFAGTPVEQAMCLMRGMDATRNLGPPLQSLPAALASRIGERTGLPSREALSGFLSRQNLEWDFAAYLWQPLSRAHDNDPDAPMARYFVIHDTSGPYFGRRSFPDDINEDPKINNLKNFICSDGWGRAHIVVNRSGEMLVAHDYSIAWRETKFEQAAEFGGALQGLFLHNELIQPRRAGARGGDGHSPDPAFSPAQYDRIALLYTIASVRAGQWLIPAFHSALDADIPDGHDDPLNFDIQSFAGSLDKIVDKLAKSEETAPLPPAAEDAGVANGGFPSDGQAVALLSTPQTDATPKPEPPSPSNAASVASPESEAESARDQKTVATEHCETRIAKGHRRRFCDADRAEGSPRRHYVRSVDRHLSREGHVARRHGGDVQPRHARSSSRHDGA